MSKALDSVAALNRVIYANEPSFGGLVSGGNNTTALQAAINAAVAVNGELRIPSGTWDHDGLTISGNITIRGEDQTKTVLRTRAGTNAHGITIPVTSGVVQNPVIENLTIDGNRTNNASAGHGLYLPDNPEPDATVSYGFSMNLRDVYIQNCREKCLHVGVNRNKGRLINVELKRGAGCLYINDSSDWRSFGCDFAFPLAGHAIHIDGGADNVFTGGAAFGALVGYPCVKLENTASQPTKIYGMTFNFNEQGAIWIKGLGGTARHHGIIVQGSWFDDNSRAAANTYSHILVEDSQGDSFVGNTFRYVGGAIQSKHLVEFAGTTGPVEWVGNAYDSVTNIPYGTAVSNTPTLLHARSQALYSDSVCYLGGAGTSYSAYIAVGVSGGNYIQIQGRASGTGPDITAQGVDTNVTLRLSSKGTGAVEMMTGALGRRVARFLDVASSVNYIDFTPSATGNAVSVTANGSDTNVDLTLVAKGSGRVRVGTHSAIGAETVTGFIEIKDAGGTVRKLAVVS